MALCRKSNNISQSFIIGTDKTSAKIYSKVQADFVNLNLSEALIFRISIAIKPSKAIMPRTIQKGINLGNCAELSNEIAIINPNKFKRHSIPKLNNTAFANMEKVRKIKVVFFIASPSFEISIA